MISSPSHCRLIITLNHRDGSNRTGNASTKERSEKEKKKTQKRQKVTWTKQEVQANIQFVLRQKKPHCVLSEPATPAGL